MIQLTEEPYDSEVAVRLVSALNEEIVERYASETEHWSEDEAVEDQIAYRLEVTPDLVRPPLGTFLVAWLDGEAVGCGALKPLAGEDGVAEVKRMYTIPAARRRGVSRALLARLEEAAGQLGYRRIQLETGTAQPEAVALYESQGWHRITPYGRYKDEPSAVSFAKDLPHVRAFAKDLPVPGGDASPGT